MGLWEDQEQVKSVKIAIKGLSGGNEYPCADGSMNYEPNNSGGFDVDSVDVS